MHINCPKRCCTITVEPYLIQHSSRDFRHKYNNTKGGVFFYDPSTQRTLLVQSRGMKWGPPKGSVESYDATVEDCAIREVQEETGIRLTREDLHTPFCIDRTTYYYIELKEQEIVIPDKINNDISGIGWVRVECVRDMYDGDSLNLNSHCRKLLKRFLQINLRNKK